MGSYPKKTIEERQNELNRIISEAERREAEIRSKNAGLEIERIERERKIKHVLSIKSRIIFNCNNTIKAQKFLIQQESNVGMELIEKIIVDNYEKYKSVKLDLRNCFKDNAGQVNDMFPDKTLSMNSSLDYFGFLTNISEEFIDILYYLERHE